MGVDPIYFGPLRRVCGLHVHNTIRRRQGADGNGRQPAFTRLLVVFEASGSFVAGQRGPQIGSSYQLARFYLSAINILIDLPLGACTLETDRPEWVQAGTNCHRLGKPHSGIQRLVALSASTLDTGTYRLRTVPDCDDGPVQLVVSTSQGASKRP